MSSARRPGDPPGPTGPADSYWGERLSMVTEQLVRRGITDARVIEAMSQAPRHLFVDPEVLDYAPYDIIVVSGAAAEIPALLLDELAEGGRQVFPLGSAHEQVITCVRRCGDDFETLQDVPCRYVNLIGRYGVGRDEPQA